jgi:hypothetical protein
MTLPSLGINLQPITIGALTWNGSAQTRLTSTSIDPLESPTQSNRQEITANANSSFTLGQFSFSQGFDLREVQLDAREQSGDSADNNFVAALPASTTRTANWNSSLNFQQRLIGTTTFTPGISVRGQFARDSITGQMVAAPMRMDFNAALKADLFAFIPGVGKVERIRHRLSPTFTYSYSPEVRTEVGTIQNRVFSADSAMEHNRLNIGLSLTFEAKLKQSDKEKATADSAAAALDTLTRDPSQPRRPPQAPKITLLSWSTDAVVYDFVQAREHLGVQTTQVSNSFNSDLLRGFQLRITHDLFRPLPLDTALPKAAQRTREFSPHLSAVSASFSLSGSAGIFRMLGLSGRKKPEAPPATGSQPTPTPQAAEGGIPPALAGADLGLLGGGRNRQQTQQPQTSPVGSWNASINYTLARPRVEGDPTVSS